MSQHTDCIAIYSRKSKFTGKGESIGNQIDLCKSYIRAQYGDAAAAQAIVYEDEGFSGRDLERPDFKNMMRAAADHEFQAIVVYRLDRISRNIGDFASLIEQLGRLDIAFISIKEQFDTGTPMGRAMMYIASVFSQLERETIAERIRDNMLELAKSGRWLGGTTPTGYASESRKTVLLDGKAKKSCHLTLIPQEAETVRSIFDLFMETGSLTAVDAELLRRHTTTKTGRSFTRFSIKTILQNPVYMIADRDAYDYFSQKQAEICSDLSSFDGTHGILAYNRTDQQKGRAAIHNPVQEWIIAVGQHPGLIPSRTWIQVQQRLEQNQSKHYHSPRGNRALLTGLLFCRCGIRMYPKCGKRKSADQSPSFFYVCKQKERSKRSRCDCCNANGMALDAAVIQQIKQLCPDTKRLLARLEKGKRLYTDSRDESDAKLCSLRAQKQENTRKLTALVDSLTDLHDTAAKRLITDRMQQLSRANDALDAHILELEGRASPCASYDADFRTLVSVLSAFSASIDAMSVEQQRAVLRVLVQTVIWDGTHAHIVLTGAQPPALTDWREDSK